MPKLTLIDRIQLERQAADTMLASLRAEFGPRFSDGYLEGVVAHRMNQINGLRSVFVAPVHRDLEVALRRAEYEPPRDVLKAILERDEQHNSHSVGWRARKRRWRLDRSVDYRWDVGEAHVDARVLHLQAEKQRKEDEKWQRRMRRVAIHQMECEHCYDSALTELAHDFYPEEDEGHWFPFLDPRVRAEFKPGQWFDWRRALMTREFNKYRNSH